MIKLAEVEDLTAKKDRKILASSIEQMCDITTDLTRQILDRITYRNILYYIGEQYVEFVRSAGSFRRRILPTYMPTPVCNQIKDFVRSTKAMLLNQKLVPKVSPNSEELEDSRAADLGGKILQWMDTINDDEFSEEKEILVIWVCLAGTAFLRTYPDMQAGKWFMTDKGIQKQGEVITQAIVPFSVRMDYSGDRLRKKRWIGLQTLMPRELVEDIFGVKVESSPSPDVIDYERKLMKLVSQVSPWKGAGLETQIYQDDQDYVLLREVEFAPTIKFPKGRYVVTCHSETLVDYDRLPIKPKDDVWHYTLTDFHWDYVPGRYWSDAPVNDMISPQNTVNEIDQLLAINRKGLGRTRIISPGKPTLERVQEGAHSFLLVKFDPLLSGGAKPEISPGIPLPIQVLEERAIAQSTIQDVSGDPKNILKGKTPSAQSSGIQIDILRETAEKSHYPDVDRYNRAMGRVYKKRLMLASEVYTEKRQGKIVGKGNKLEIFAFKGADLHQNTDVRLELDSGISTTKAGQSQLLMQLAKIGLFGPIDANPDLREEFLNRMGLSGVTNQANVDMERAQKENAAVSAGKPQDIFLAEMDQQSGQPMVVNDDPLFKYDNHQVHFEIHRRFILSPQFADLPKQAQTILLAHADIHESIMQLAMAQRNAAMVQGQQTKPGGQGKSAGGGNGAGVEPMPGEPSNPMDLQESELGNMGG